MNRAEVYLIVVTADQELSEALSVPAGRRRASVLTTANLRKAVHWWVTRSPAVLVLDSRLAGYDSEVFGHLLESPRAVEAPCPGETSGTRKIALLSEGAASAAEAAYEGGFRLAGTFSRDWDPALIVSNLCSLLVPEAPKSPAARPEPLSPAAAPRIKQILVVEDDPAVALLLEELFTRMGHRVRVAPDGMEAIIAYEEDRYDLITLDCALPYLSGLEVHQLLARHFGKEDRDYPDQLEPLPPVILITGFAGTEAIRQYQQQQRIVSTVAKPFDLGQLAALVANILREEEERRLDPRASRRQREGWEGPLAGIISSVA